MNAPRSARPLARALALLALTACPGPAGVPAPAAAVSGTVTYRERVALPPDAELRVALFDVTREELARAPVADTVIRVEGRQVPLPFVLRFDPARIDHRHLYALRGTIDAAGRPLFASRSVVQVITWDHPTIVSLVLAPTAAAATDTAPAAPGAGSPARAE